MLFAAHSRTSVFHGEQGRGGAGDSLDSRDKNVSPTPHLEAAPLQLSYILEQHG